MKLYAKIFIEFPHGDCVCSIGELQLPTAILYRCTDDDAKKLLDNAAAVILSRTPGAIRILSLEYISEQEAKDIIAYQKKKSHNTSEDDFEDDFEDDE